MDAVGKYISRALHGGLTMSISTEGDEVDELPLANLGFGEFIGMLYDSRSFILSQHEYSQWGFCVSSSAVVVENGNILNDENAEAYYKKRITSIIMLSIYALKKNNRILFVLPNGKSRKNMLKTIKEVWKGHTGAQYVLS